MALPQTFVQTGPPPGSGNGLPMEGRKTGRRGWDSSGRRSVSFTDRRAPDSDHEQQIAARLQAEQQFQVKT